MDKEQLNRAFDSIQTSSQKKEQILGELENMYSSDFLSEKKKRDRTKKAWMKKLSAAAAIIVALVIPGAIYADDIRDFFMGFLNRDAQITEYVKQNVYEDSDGHLKMTVEELLSDQKMVRAVISYEALDDEGIQWLQSFDESDYRWEGKYMKHDTDSNWLAHAAMGLYPENLTTMSHDFCELKEFRTDQTRFFELFYEVGCPDNAKTASLFYPMTTEVCKEATLDITPNMEIKEYRLVGDTNVNKYYDVMYIRLTDLSYVVYGTQKGLYSHTRHPEGGFSEYSLVADEEPGKIYPKVILHLKDGTEYSNLGFALSPVSITKDGYINVEDFHGADTLICSSSYYAAYLSNRSEEGGQSEPISIKIEDIESVTINGHDFTLEEME